MNLFSVERRREKHMACFRRVITWALRRAATCRSSALEAEGNAVCHGPITQAHFLEALGIRERLQGLLQTASQEEGEQLISGYYRLVGSSSSDANTQAQACMLPAGFAIACSIYVCADMRLCQRKLHTISIVLHDYFRSVVNLR